MEQIGQGFVSEKGITATDVNTLEGTVNKAILEEADNLINKYDLDAEDLKNEDPTSFTTYYSYNKVLKALREEGEIAAADRLEALYNTSRGTTDQYSGVNKQQAPKPLGKW